MLLHALCRAGSSIGTNALAQLQIDSGVPIIHGVLLFENEDQAAERCLRKDTNRGIEAARTAREMVGICRQFV